MALEEYHSMFNYDWFIGSAFEAQKRLARQNCARKHFPEVTDDNQAQNAEYQKFLSELEVRTLIYLRDGFSYEFKGLVDVGLRSMLTFECEPVDEQYKVGAFLVSLAFDEILRVEVFAVHPSEKPADMPVITGFRCGPNEPQPQQQMREEPREQA